MLDATKAELREFVRERKIHFRDDATNATLDAPRNRVRNELLPLLQRHYQPALAKTVLRLMEIVGAEADLVGETARQWLEISCRSRGDEAHIKARKSQSSRVGSLTSGVPAFRQLAGCGSAAGVALELAELGVTPDFERIEQIRESPGEISCQRRFRRVPVARDADGNSTAQNTRPAG